MDAADERLELAERIMIAASNLTDERGLRILNPLTLDQAQQIAAMLEGDPTDRSKT